MVAIIHERTGPVEQDIGSQKVQDCRSGAPYRRPEFNSVPTIMNYDGVIPESS